jgi:hypothetical protein
MLDLESATKEFALRILSMLDRFAPVRKITAKKRKSVKAGTSIKRGGHGGSVKCQNSNLQQFF